MPTSDAKPTGTTALGLTESIIKDPSWGETGAYQGGGNSMNSTDLTELYGRKVTRTGLGLESNQAAYLKEGFLMVTHMERVYQIDPSSGAIEFCFQLHREPRTNLWTALPASDGRVYCSLSGALTKTEPLATMEFGGWGTVVRVDPVEAVMDTVIEDLVTDPFGLDFVRGDQTQLLVCDFNGWGGTGSVILVDTRLNASQIVATGGLLGEPSHATLDDDDVLWIADAQHRGYYGRIIRVESGNQQEIVYEGSGPGSGIIVGLFPSNSNDSVIFVVIDWPFMADSAVCRLDKKNGKVKVLLDASKRDPKLYNMRGTVVNNTLWITESYNNKLLAYDLKTNKVVMEHDISPILGRTKGDGVRGVFDSFDFIETLTVVPKQTGRQLKP